MLKSPVMITGIDFSGSLKSSVHKDSMKLVVLIFGLLYTTEMHTLGWILLESYNYTYMFNVRQRYRELCENHGPRL
jgi:hypothetical protein